MHAEPEVALSFDGAMGVLQSCEGGDTKETATLDRLLKALNVIEKDLEEEGVRTLSSQACSVQIGGQMGDLYTVV